MTDPEKIGNPIELFPRRFGKTAFIQKFKHQATNSTEDYIVFDTNTNPATVLPFTRNKTIIAIRQFRYAVNERVIEFPGGNIERGESPEKIAGRELEEETGYRARQVKRLTNHPIWYDPSSLTTPFQPCIALDCEKVSDPKLEADEYLEVLEFSVDVWIAMIRRGEVRDAKTIVTTFLALPVIAGTT